VISDTAIKRLIGEPDYSRGATYFRQGKVLDVEVEGDDFVAGEVSGSGAPPPEKLFYVFRAERFAGAQIVPFKARILKNGGIGKSSSEYTTTNNLSMPPRFVTLDDVGILQKLASLRGFGQRYSWPEGEALFVFLREIIATGRARGFTVDGPELHWAAPRKGRFEWQMEEGGAQRLALLDEGGAPVEALPFAPPLHIDRETGACGLVETDLTPNAAALSVVAPVIPPEAAYLVMEQMASRRSRVPAPKSVEIKERKGELVPVLRLLGWPLRIPAHRAYGYARSGEALEMIVPGVRAAFDYGGTLIAPDAEGDPPDGGRCRAGLPSGDGARLARRWLADRDR